jgi:putative two-component system response regulator
MALGKALDILREGRGTHFDPELLDLFLSSFDSVVAIKSQYADGLTPGRPPSSSRGKLT